jgi:hypothetical protein
MFHQPPNSQPIVEVVMLSRKFFKNRGFGVNMLACTAFLLLAVYGWGLPGKDLLSYFLIGLVCLAVVMGLAFLAGLLLRKILNRKE